MRSLLLPISMMVMLGLACWRASSSQPAKWLNVSRLRTAHRGVTLTHARRTADAGTAPPWSGSEKKSSCARSPI